tara:strand:+ start:216 stop:434 length:219 start_codon:yes stop_codon:yes gene_type:complete
MLNRLKKRYFINQIFYLFQAYCKGINPPSAPKELNSHIAVLGFQAITIFLLGSASFVLLNKEIFVRNLTVKH